MFNSYMEDHNDHRLCKLKASFPLFIIMMHNYVICYFTIETNVTHTKNFSVLYYNARSILPKIDNLAANCLALSPV